MTIYWSAFVFVFAWKGVVISDGATRTVGNGSPGSCTDAELDARIAELVDEDILDFSCGPNEHTIKIQSHKWIDKSVIIDGGGKIVLHGQEKYRHFIFAQKDTLQGIFADNMQVTVSNIRLIYGNASDISMGRRRPDGSLTMNNPVPKQDGGSIYMGKRGFLTMSHVTITHSKCLGIPDMVDSVDERNYITFRGGAVYIGVECEAIVDHCIFAKNIARQEGGAFYARWQATRLTITHSVFIMNEAYDEDKNNGGGAIFVQETFFTCDYCLFRGNRAQTGGAIRNLMTETTLRHCIFSKNSADYKTTLMNNLQKPIKGGAFYVDGARTLATGEASSKITITNCTFEENSAEKGGGVYLCLYAGDSFLITDSSFCGNWVNTSEPYTFPTGAAFNRDCVGEFTMRRVVMGGNTVTHRNNNEISPDETFNDSPGDGTVSTSDIPGVKSTTGSIVQPPGPLCPLTFCAAFSDYCDESFGEEKQSCGTAWKDWDRCSLPCGGCGTQRRSRIRCSGATVYQHRQCNICPCRRTIDPIVFSRFASNSKGRIVGITRNTPCCFEFQGLAVAEELDRIKHCYRPKVHGWTPILFNRNSKCTEGNTLQGHGRRYIGL